MHWLSVVAIVNGRDRPSEEILVMSASLERYLFSVDEYERMGERGVFAEDTRVELIYGEIVQMSPIGGRHVNCLSLVNRSATRQTGDDLFVQIQGPIRMPNRRSEPQPELVIARGDFDLAKPPEVPAVLLVGEVSDSTLDSDRSVKLPLYASAGIPEAWLFNLVAERIERHTDPQPDGYRTVAFAEQAQRLESTVIPGLIFDTDELVIRVTRA
jgi:Uma2 family endonuclease